MNRSTFFKVLLALPFVPGMLAKLKPASYVTRAEADAYAASRLTAPRIRYGLCPGWVVAPPEVITSAEYRAGAPLSVLRSLGRDGATERVYRENTNYVSARELAELYGVKMEECVVFKTVSMDPRIPDSAVWALPYAGAERGLIMLLPRVDGDYTLPTAGE